MAYVGQEPNGSFTTNVSKDTFDGDGSTTAFTLTEGASTNTVDVFVENVRQEPTEAYSVDGTTLTFTAAPPTGTGNIYVVNKSPVRLQAAHPAGLALEAHSATISTDLTVDTDTLVVDSTNNRVGIGTDAPDATGLHVHTGSAGSLTPNSAADDLVVESNGNAGITIASPDANYSGIIFSSPTDVTGSIIEYNQSGATFDIGTATSGGELRLRSGGFTHAWSVLANGNLKAATNGLGIDFSASEGSGASSSVLDDYEEGTCTLTTNVSGGLTQSNSTRYTKVGRLVTVHFDVTFGADTSGADMTVSGLPFNPLNYGSGMINWTDEGGDMPGGIHVYTSGGNGFFTIQIGTDGNTPYSRSAVANNRFIGSLFYDTNS